MVSLDQPYYIAFQLLAKHFCLSLFCNSCGAADYKGITWLNEVSMEKIQIAENRKLTQALDVQQMQEESNCDSQVHSKICKLLHSVIAGSF